MFKDYKTTGEVKVKLSIKDLIEVIKGSTPQSMELSACVTGSLNEMIGKKVIIRTYSAGVWFGLLEQKSGNEVILRNARRMWRWQTKQSISLSSVAVYGIDEPNSKIAVKVDSVWLEAIEIIPCTDESITSIEGAKDVKSS